MIELLRICQKWIIFISLWSILVIIYYFPETFHTLERQSILATVIWIIGLIAALIIQNKIEKKERTIYFKKDK